MVEKGEQTVRVVFERNVACPMRDGVTLRANVFRPEEGGPYPVILTRLPYGKDTGFAYGLLDPIRLAETGYIVVIQDVRGCFASEGEFAGFAQEFQDGYDTVEWASKLPGADGQVGMYGASYFAYTQWAAAASGHPALRVLTPTVSFDDAWAGSAFRDGAFEWGLSASWYTTAMAIVELMRKKRGSPDFPELFGRLVFDANHLPEFGYYELPLDQFSPLKRAGVLEDFFTQLRHSTYDENWRAISIRPHYEKMQVSAYLVGGWYDVFLDSTIGSFQAIRKNGQDARLLIGPWTHSNYSNAVGELDFGMAANSSFLNFQYDSTTLHQLWFDQQLKKLENPLAKEPPIKLFVMGENAWRYAGEWPLPETVWTPYYLHSDGHANSISGNGSLNTTTPDEEAPDHYVYDPANPVPTTGGNLLMTPTFRPGPANQAVVEQRDDVLIFTSEALTEPLTVIGPVKAKLWIKTSAKDTDFVVRLTDVYPDGRSINLADGVQRMRYRDSIEVTELVEPGEVYAIEVNLWATGNVFLPGHRVRVQVTSSNFPRWNRNLNTGESNETTSAFIVAEQTLLHDADHPSHIVLPVIP